MVVMADGLQAVPMAFDRWMLHGDGRLTGPGSDVQLPPKEWHVLRLLLVSAGSLVTKDRLLEQIWPHGDAAEESLTRCIYSLRKYLKADKAHIKTVYGSGYRFACPVRVMSVPGRCPSCGRDPE
jgi:two-component system OmpR family response regulator